MIKDVYGKKRHQQIGVNNAVNYNLCFVVKVKKKIEIQIMAKN